jgi:hypothetical protein
VLTGQNVELEINVVELADRPGLLLASVYLECGYGGGGEFGRLPTCRIE